jgi:adenylate kinase
VIIHLDAPDDVLVQRALGRGRSDSNEIEKISQGLLTYQKETVPVLEYFGNQGIPIWLINGNQARDKIDSEVMFCLNKTYQRTLRTITN